MSNKIKKITLTCLFAVLPLMSHAAQTCKNGSIPATTMVKSPFTTSGLIQKGFTINGNGTVTDPNTRLIWKRCSEGQTFNATTSACDDTATMFGWKEALLRAETVRTDGFAGANDWRLPNIKELRSIVERPCLILGRHHPLIKPAKKNKLGKVRVL